MQVEILNKGAALVAHKGQLWLFGAPKGVAGDLRAIGVSPDCTLISTVRSPGIGGLSEWLGESFKSVRQLPLNGDGLMASAVEREHGWDYVIKTDEGHSILFSLRGDVSVKDTDPHDLSVIGNTHRANAFDERVITRPWPDLSISGVSLKKWKTLDAVPENLKGMGLSLSQANHVAAIADAVEADEPWAVAVAQFKDEYKKDGKNWVKRKAAKRAYECKDCDYQKSYAKKPKDCPECEGGMRLATTGRAVVVPAAIRGVAAETEGAGEGKAGAAEAAEKKPAKVEDAEEEPEPEKEMIEEEDMGPVVGFGKGKSIADYDAIFGFESKKAKPKPTGEYKCPECGHVAGDGGECPECEEAIMVMQMTEEGEPETGEGATEHAGSRAVTAGVSSAVKKVTKDGKVYAERGGKQYPAGDYLVVEKGDEPSTWHLPFTKEPGTPDRGMMGAAAAALGPGYRGKKYEGPSKKKAIDKLRGQYRKMKVDEGDWPEGIRTKSLQAALSRFRRAFEKQYPDDSYSGEGTRTWHSFMDVDLESNTAYVSEHQRGSMENYGVPFTLTRGVITYAPREDWFVAEQRWGEAQRLGGAYRMLIKTAEPDLPDDVDLSIGRLAVFKSGKVWRWATVSSADVVDKQEERFSTKAMDWAIAYGHLTGDRGPLRFEHVPGLDGGGCDKQMRVGDLLLEAGYFLDTPLGNAMRLKMTEDPTAYGVSLGLRYGEDDLIDGVYQRALIFERSMTRSPAVPVTSIGAYSMQLTEEMLKAYADELGMELTDLQALVELAMKAEKPPDSLEALKAAIDAGQEGRAIDKLFDGLSPEARELLAAKFAPDTEGEGEGETPDPKPADTEDALKTDIAALKSTVASAVENMRAVVDANAALVTALKGGDQPSLEKAIADYFSTVPRKEAVAFAATKSTTISAEDLESMQKRMNQMEETMKKGGLVPSGQTPFTQVHSLFTSKRLNLPVES